MKPFRYLLVLFIFSLCFHVATGQKKKPKDEFYTFDRNWKPSSADSAIYFIVVSPTDSGFEWDYYYDHGPLLRVEPHITHDGAELNGTLYLYTRWGDLDSTVSLDHGVKNGNAYKFDFASDGRRFIRKKYTYLRDSLVEVKDYTAEEEERVAKALAEKSNPGLKKNDKVPTEEMIRKQIRENPTDTSLQVESSFPGGLKAWQSFLEKNLKYPDEAVNRNLSGRIDVVFEVDTLGRTNGFYIRHSASFWLDREALRVLKKSGRWMPAYKHCQLVKSYKIQPISMKLDPSPEPKEEFPPLPTAAPGR